MRETFRILSTEFARKSQTSGDARARHFSAFERLSHHFQGGAFEFRQLIQEKDADVREADFPPELGTHRRLTNRYH